MYVYLYGGKVFAILKSTVYMCLLIYNYKYKLLLSVVHSLSFNGAFVISPERGTATSAVSKLSFFTTAVVFVRTRRRSKKPYRHLNPGITHWLLLSLTSYMARRGSERGAAPTCAAGLEKKTRKLKSWHKSPLTITSPATWLWRLPPGSQFLCFLMHKRFSICFNW